MSLSGIYIYCNVAIGHPVNLIICDT